MTSYPRLLQPIKINSMRLRNRVMMPAVATKLGTEEGAVSQRFIDFYEERARGGTALIIMENTCIDWPLGKGGVAPIRLDNDKYIIGMGDLAEAVHRYGAKMATQLQHTGAATGWVNTEGEHPIAPSPLPIKDGGMAREMTRADMERVIHLFAEAARRTKMAELDAVELHGAHGYILTQFLSPAFNKRTDGYGGDIYGRMRFPLEVLRAVRVRVGPDFPIIYRYSVDEHLEDGLPLEEAQIFARALQENGADLISVTAGVGMGSREWVFPPMYVERGCNRHLGRAIKDVVSIPVAVVGRINDPDTAESILASGDADMVCLGRPLVADPDYVSKVAAGRAEDIIPCISCNDGCIGRTHVHRRLGCVVNPCTGFEAETAFQPAETQQRVLVIGGGPGGMETAALAAERGHRVILCDKADQLGGQLLLGGIPSFKDEINTYRDFLVRRLRKRWVEVRTGTEVTPQLVAELDPDVVVLATGGVPCCPSFPGAERDEVVTFDVALKSPEKVGRRVVVVGGGETGCETALFLARSDPKREVTIVEMLDAILMTAEKANRLMLEKLLPAAGIEILTNCAVQSVDDQGVKVVHDGSPKVLAADHVVCALGTRPHGTELKDALVEQGFEVYAIGDCVAPRKIWYATHEGAEIARSL